MALDMQYGASQTEKEYVKNTLDQEGVKALFDKEITNLSTKIIRNFHNDNFLAFEVNKTFDTEKQSMKDIINQDPDMKAKYEAAYNRNKAKGGFSEGILLLQTIAIKCITILSNGEEIEKKLASRNEAANKSQAMDGVLGPNTFYVLASIAKEKNIPFNGVVDKPLLDAMINICGKNEYDESEIQRQIKDYKTDGLPSERKKADMPLIVAHPTTGKYFVLDLEKTSDPNTKGKRLSFGQNGDLTTKEIILDNITYTVTLDNGILKFTKKIEETITDPTKIEEAITDPTKIKEWLDTNKFNINKNYTLISLYDRTLKGTLDNIQKTPFEMTFTTDLEGARPIVIQPYGYEAIFDATDKTINIVPKETDDEVFTIIENNDPNMDPNRYSKRMALTQEEKQTVKTIYQEVINLTNENEINAKINEIGNLKIVRGLRDVLVKKIYMLEKKGKDVKYLQTISQISIHRELALVDQLVDKTESIVSKYRTDPSDFTIATIPLRIDKSQYLDDKESTIKVFFMVQYGGNDIEKISFDTDGHLLTNEITKDDKTYTVSQSENTITIKEKNAENNTPPVTEVQEEIIF